MAEDRDESDERKPGAEGLGNDEDTEKGEAQLLDDEVEAKPTKGDDASEAKAESAAEDEPADKDDSDDEAERDAKSDAKDDDAAKDDERDAKDDERDAKSDAAQATAKSKDKRGGGRWWIALLVILVVEFYVYGRNGDIEVCVGKQDVHDFSLVGQERTDQNRWKFPRCESRVNLGLRSQYDELVEDATNVACRGATLFRNRGEGPQCVAGEQGWTKQVETSYIWPWDSRYYEHLLWFIFE